MKGLPLVAVLALLVLSGCSETFEDCVLENMEKAQNPAAASMIRKACQDKHSGAGGWGNNDEIAVLPSLDLSEFMAPQKVAQQTPQKSPSQAEKDHFGAIFAAHPNADTLMEEEKFLKWSDTPARQHVLDSGTTQEVIHLFDEYVEYKNTPVIISSDSPSSSLPSKPKCVYKSVMSNDDYAACGLSPPTITAQQ